MKNQTVHHPSDRAAVLEWARLRPQAAFLILSFLLTGAPAATRPPAFEKIPIAYIEDAAASGRSYLARSGEALLRFRLSGFDVATAEGTAPVEFVNANPVLPAGAGSAAGRANFLTGPRERWRTEVPMYGEIRYVDLYPGVDAIFGSAGALLKSEFFVAPGADPARIRLRYRGARRVAVAGDGGLEVETAVGILREGAPFAYQWSAAGRQEVAARYQVEADGTVGFVLGGYRDDLPLVIDPVFAYSTYLGGSNIDWAHALAVDSTGAAYITGYTMSPDFATASGPPQQLPQGNLDAFVVKVHPQGNSLVYWTFLGGSGPDRGNAIAVDADGNAYIAGETESANFPVSGGFQTTATPGRNGFVVKLNPSGSSPVWSSFLGGSQEDLPSGIALDAARNVYVGGWTFSTNFPVVQAFQSTAAGAGDGFLCKIKHDGTSLLYSTYLGGQAADEVRSVAVDSAGAAYVAGHTSSPDFPALNAAQPTIGGGSDAFVAKFSPAGNILVYSTFLGGSREERVLGRRALAVDGAGAAYVGGRTHSTDFPLQNAVKTALFDVDDAFVTKISPTGNALVFSTYLGGSGSDDVRGLALDAAGRAHVTGRTSSFNFPVVNAPVSMPGGLYNLFVARFSASGAALERSELIGGGGDDEPQAIALDSSGAIYVAGGTTSQNFPLQNPVQNINYGGLGAFVFKLANPGAPAAISVSPPGGSGSAATFTFTYSDPDGFADITVASALIAAAPSTANACFIRYTRAANSLQLANDAGGGWTGSVTPGGAGSLENSQCVIHAAGSSVNGAGNNLTLVVAVTFRTTFAGARNVYLDVADSASTAAGWQSLGAWTVTAGGPVPPVLVSVTPASGSGSQQSFQFVYSSVYGAQDLNWLFANVAPANSTVGACMVRYVRATNQLELARDDGSGWAGQGALGAQVLIQNSQCIINLAFSSVTASAGALTLTLSVTFKASFVGARTVFMAALNGAGILTGWTAMGSYTVLFNYTPVPVSVTPASGSGASRVFEFAYSDQNGFADIAWTAMLIHAALTPVNSCLLRFTRTTNQLELANDAGAFTNVLTTGFHGSIQNSQCIVDGLNSAAIIAGNQLTVRVALTFKPAYSGPKNIYMTVADNPGNVAAWAVRGTWTVP